MQRDLAERGADGRVDGDEEIEMVIKWEGNEGAGEEETLERAETSGGRT